MNLPFNRKTQWQMFLLVSGGHVGAHPDGHQHGAFTESALFLRMFRVWKNHTDLNLGEGLSISTSFHFSDSGIYRFIFIFASVTIKLDG